MTFRVSAPYNAWTITGDPNLPKSPLDAADVVLKPVVLGNLLLADGDAGPLDTHNSDLVNIVLVELDLQGREVTGGPLLKTPLLDNLEWFLKLNELADHVSAKKLELAARLGTLPDLGRSASESGDTAGVGEGLVELLSGGAELLVIGDSSGVDLDGAVAAGLGGGAGGRARGGSLRNELGGGEAARGVGTGSMLDILAVLGDEGRGELQELLAELGNKLVAHKVLDGPLLVGIRVDINIEHELVLLQLMGHLGNGNGARDIVVGGSGAYMRNGVLARGPSIFFTSNSSGCSGKSIFCLSQGAMMMMALFYYGSTYLRTPGLT